MEIISPPQAQFARRMTANTQHNQQGAQHDELYEIIQVHGFGLDGSSNTDDRRVWHRPAVRRRGDGYADTQIDTTTAIALGGSQTGSGLKGDWLAGNDTIMARTTNGAICAVLHGCAKPEAANDPMLLAA